ncbi:hypothetical protein CPT_Slocum_022 [Serratia phage Slocum]|nr:hypothetical protein CPT_Slocum_022 [Serratia phage Slocum]
MKCKYCDGLGLVEADVGQLFECNPCNGTGIDPYAEVIGLPPILEREYTLTTSGIVTVIAEVNRIGWNMACELVADAGLHGEDGCGYCHVELECVDDYPPQVTKALKHIFARHPGVTAFKLVDEY